jgi:transposase InsO family protein
VWCWDITWLDAPLKGTYFYLYMAIDMFSRKVVAWEVYAKEDGTLARDLFAEAMKAEGIQPGTLLIHADNGRPMRSHQLRTLFDVLQVNASYGRPHTSNDNAFAEILCQCAIRPGLLPGVFHVVQRLSPAFQSGLRDAAKRP